MTSPTTTITQKFLSRPQELGVVAVGFSDGQVGPQLSPRDNSVSVTLD